MSLSKNRRVVFALAAGALLALATMILAFQPGRAAGPWYVTPGGDDGNDCLSPGAPCATINGAIGKASSGDTIYVAAGTYTGTGDQVVLLDKDATLSGGWDETFTSQDGTSSVDGDSMRRGMTVSGGTTATIELFVIRNGRSDGFIGDGGGIANRGTLTLINSKVSDNFAVGAFINGGGIYNVGTMVLDSSAVSGNAAYDGSGGGIYSSYGTMILNNSSVRDNMNIGIYFVEGTVTLNNSTASGNMGGGIRNMGGNLILNNSTVSNNTAQSGGGIDQNGGTMILSNCTVSGNTVNTSGGGISKGGGIMLLQNTILADNTSRLGVSPDCSGDIGSWGYNLLGDTSGCDFSPGMGDLTDVEPNLGQLIGTPGTPVYRPLLFGSPATDAGNPMGCTDDQGSPLDTDQRGAARVGRCDIGAYEYTSPGPAASVYAFGGTPQSTPPSLAFRMPLQAAVLDSIGSPVDSATVTFSAPESGASGTFADSDAYTTVAVTAETGVAIAAAFTANELTGDYTVTATVSDITVPAVFLMDNVGWYVIPGGDDGADCQTPATPCATIDGVLEKAGFAAGDTVLVSSGTYTGTGDEVVLLNRDATLSGGWDETFTTQGGRSTFDGEGARRGITVIAGVTAAIERFIVQNGSVAYSAAGGGIINDRGILALDNSIISDNVAERRGGGIENRGILTLSNSIITSNLAFDGDGGGVYNAGTMTVDDSAISGNTALNRGGGINGGALILNNSIVSDNVATYSDGGGLNCGPVIMNNSIVRDNTASRGGGISGGPLNLKNSTVSGNTALAYGGGIFNYGSTVYLNSCTVSNNVAGYGAGIYNNSGSVTSAIVIMKNSILAGNIADLAPDCYHFIDTLGYNLIGDTSGGCLFTPGTGDLTNIDAKLFPLMGSPGYHPLPFMSPAVDAANPAGCTDNLGDPLLTDQRGAPRPLDGDGDGDAICDIGAYEFDPANDPIAAAHLPYIARYYCPPGFFDDFGNPASGWAVVDDSYVRTEYLDGEYRVLTKQSGYFYLFGAPTCDRRNYTVEVDARWVGTPGSSYGLIFGVTGGYGQYYLFIMNTDYQEFLLLRRDPSGFVMVVPYTSAPAINGGTASNHLKVTRNGDGITLEVNGTALGTWYDGTIGGLTGAGVVTNPYSNLPNSDARFDNFSMVTLLGGGASVPDSGSATPDEIEFVAPNARRDPMPADMAW